MHEYIFANAAFSEGATVLRMALRPYSIGHEILLWKSANPLVTYSEDSFCELDEDVQRGKLFMAAFICERTWKENHSKIKWPRLTSFFRRNCDTAKEVEKFFDYRTAGCYDFVTVPQPRVPGVPYHYFGAPELARLIPFAYSARLHEVVGVESVFDVPLALARMVYSADLEAQGKIWVQNHHDHEEKLRQQAFEVMHPENTFAYGDDAVQASAEKWNQEHPECPVPLSFMPKNTKN